MELQVSVVDGRKHLTCGDRTTFVGMLGDLLLERSPSMLRQDFFLHLKKVGRPILSDRELGYGTTLDDLDQMGFLDDFADYLIARGLGKVTFQWTYDGVDTDVVRTKD